MAIVRTQVIEFATRNFPFLGSFKEIILDTFQLVKKVYFNCDSNMLLPSPPSPKKAATTRATWPGQYRSLAN